MIFRQLQIAYERTQDFFGPRALVIGLIPIVYWILIYLSDGSPITKHLVILGATYAAIGSAVFLIQFIKGGKVVESEVEHQKTLAGLLPDEQQELKLLVRLHKIRVGQNVFDQIAGKTPFIYRDGRDAWRIEEEYRKFLERWAKK
jgi:hypothetical protein